MKNRNSKKLVLFDIDGTLIRSVGETDTLRRFSYAIEHVFGISIEVSKKTWKYNGVLDRGILWDMVRDKGVKQEDFLEKLPVLDAKFQEYFDSLNTRKPMYEIINGAKDLFDALRVKKDIHIGVLTGNLKSSAFWKLSQVGLHQSFPFGLYGHEAEERADLARLVFSRAKKYFNKEFLPEEVVIIGDTVHDITCGKAIGAVTIAVTTGWNPDRTELAALQPDFLVDSLMDKSVRDFFGI